MTMSETPEALLRRYDVSPINGFLSDRSPLWQLSNPYYQPWESLICDLPKLLQTRQFRTRILQLPILKISCLKNKEEFQRAYVILAFLTHAYFWGEGKPSERLPPQLTCPLLEISECFGLPPTATYAATSMWNYALKSPHSEITNPDELRVLHTFTGTRDEEWFYLISTTIEASGAAVILELLRCIKAVEEKDSTTVASSLQNATTGIEKLGRLLDRMHEHCDPQVFYHNIRPFLAGSKGMVFAGMPKGVFYDTGDSSAQWRQYSGGSNAQSSLIQFFDIALGVNHYSTGLTSSPGSSNSQNIENSYITEMRNYMPKAHRQFLSHIGLSTNIRQFVFSTSADASVRDAYNRTVSMLSKFRDIHINIVTRYIIMPSRSPSAAYIEQKPGLNLATASSASQKSKFQKPQLHGTGGTMLIPFLKQTRDETKSSSI